MAMQLNVVAPSGLVCPSAYSVVLEVVINPHAKRAGITIRTWADQSMKTSAKTEVIPDRFFAVEGDEYDEWFNSEKLESSNPIAQSYLYVKQADEGFGKSEDV